MNQKKDRENRNDFVKLHKDEEIDIISLFPVLHAGLNVDVVVLSPHFHLVLVRYKTSLLLACGLLWPHHRLSFHVEVS